MGISASSFLLIGLRWVAFVFLLGWFTCLHGQATTAEVEKLLDAGRKEADRGEFAKALGHFNKAMGYLKQASPSHPLNEVVRREIKITKGRSLVARFQNRSGLKIHRKDEPLPLDQEPEEVLVNQCFGTILARQVWTPREITGSGEFLGLGRRLTILPKGGVELFVGKERNFSVRSVDAASLALPEAGVFDLHSGAFAISSSNDGSSCTIKSPLSSLKLSCPKTFAVMVGITTNGGLKVMGLMGDCILEQPDAGSSTLKPGELVFILPEGFSRKMSVELSTLMVTSKLMTGFDDPPVYHKKVRQQAMIQALRTKKRYKAVVGDAKNSDDFEIRVLKPERP